MAPAPPAQVLLSVPLEPREVAGVPAVVRVARSLAESGRVFLCTRSRESIAPWRGRLEGLGVEEVASYNGARPLRERLDPAAPALVVTPEGYPDPHGLLRFIEEASSASGPSAWVCRGRVLATYFPRAERLLERMASGSREFPSEGLAEPQARPRPASPDAWQPLDGPESVVRAEERFYESLRSETDGYLARLDRRLSIAISRRLVGTPVTPNQITAFSLALGLSGAWLLASPVYARSVLGAALLWLCCVLDGCDGEVARLKLLASSWGARFDVVADNVVHLAIFAAIPIQLHRLHPGMSFKAPGLTLMTGVVLSMFWVWWFILRQPDDLRGPVARVYERLASRDFIYLVALLAVSRRLEWFLWSAAVGSHVFWLSLVAVSLLRPKRAAAS